MMLDGFLGWVTPLIVQACDPERVILFGSWAKGQQNSDSDLDILVIADSQRSTLLLRHELQQLLYPSPIRIDIHVVTTAEVKAESGKPFGFLSSVLSRSTTLYVKSCAAGNA
ncbi:MAG: nucleotidyltransferase domain-containing protein [Nitrospira sp.]|nr:nucleotidyltransferase domain-containing protein [Nitrospira sp.]MDH4244952.1 nucleotidyltransferase domain-containing protein [Nitrospira sp.]MDH4354843.1 nucleotidyltransferase domain-containing protein [Nitrospira sp.]MDH5317083.1 nucleotidyltransferase domain-containing protein [Nitrospira sp.]